MRRKAIRRGALFYADLDPVIGSEQGGTRPILILQNDVGNYFSPTVVAAAITSRRDKTHLPTHVLLEDVPGLAPTSLLLLEQIRTVDRRRLRGYIGQISKKKMKEIDTKICFMCSNFHSIFRTHFAIANIFSILYFFPLQILHECAKEVRLRTFFALPNLCVCFL